MSPQRDNRVKVSALHRSGHKVSEVANLVGLAQSSTRSTMRRCQQTCRQWLKDCCSSNDIPHAVSRMASRQRSSPSNSIPQAVTIHKSLAITACASVNTFAIVYALLDSLGLECFSNFCFNTFMQLLHFFPC